MKTERFVFSLLLAVAGGLFFADVCSARQAGEVLMVRKEVYLIHEGEKISAAPQSPLFMKDSVETARQARTKLFFEDDSVLNLGELSRVVVQEYLSQGGNDRSKSIYQLLEGSLKVSVGRSELEIHTPTAVAAARGTRFIMWVTGSGDHKKTGIMVLEGEVLLRNIQEMIKGIQTIRSGQTGYVSSGSPPAPPVPTAPARLARQTTRTMALGAEARLSTESLPLIPQLQRTGLDRVMESSLNEVADGPPLSQIPIGAGTHSNLILRIGWDEQRP